MNAPGKVHMLDKRHVRTTAGGIRSAMCGIFRGYFTTVEDWAEVTCGNCNKLNPTLEREPKETRLERLERIERAARRLCLARERIAGGGLNATDVTSTLSRRDAALHDLQLLLGMGCECDEGTCPGIIGA